MLSKSQEQLISEFILNFGIKRRDDQLKTEALKLIGHLKELPEYEFIIEEGAEDSITAKNDQVVTYLRKDAKVCNDLPYIIEILKLVI